MSLTWKGKAVRDRVDQAARQAIDETTSECVNVCKTKIHIGPGVPSKPGEPPHKQTTLLQGSIQMRHAKNEGKRIVGQWGSYDVVYALWLEIGTAHMAPRPYLRVTADAQYPLLHRRIQARLK